MPDVQEGDQETQDGVHVKIEIGFPLRTFNSKQQRMFVQKVFSGLVSDKTIERLN